MDSDTIEFEHVEQSCLSGIVEPDKENSLILVAEPHASESAVPPIKQKHRCGGQENVNCRCRKR